MSIKCGDCLERLAELPNRTIDLVVTSPPYNLRNTTGGQGGGEKNNRWKASPLMKGNDRTYKRKTHAFRGALVYTPLKDLPVRKKVARWLFRLLLRLT